MLLLEDGEYTGKSTGYDTSCEADCGSASGYHSFTINKAITIRAQNPGQAILKGNDVQNAGTSRESGCQGQTCARRAVRLLFEPTIVKSHTPKILVRYVGSRSQVMITSTGATMATGVVFDGVVITNGAPRRGDPTASGCGGQGCGGGVFINRAPHVNLTLINSQITANWADHGAGVYMDQNSATICSVKFHDSRIESNTAANNGGGGVFFRGGGAGCRLSMANTAVHGNTCSGCSSCVTDTYFGAGLNVGGVFS